MRTLLFLTAVVLGLSTLSTNAQTKWFKYEGNPVLNVGSPGSWDAATIHADRVIRQDSIFVMWFMGFDGATAGRIGRATSHDGVTWTKDSRNPIVREGAPGSWESKGSVHPYVLYNGSSYQMWYMGVDDGFTFRLGTATSPDGIVWTKDSLNPILGPGSWYSVGPTLPCILPGFSDSYQMWFAGEHTGHVLRIGHASGGYPGIAWTPGPDPVLTPGGPGSWDDRNVFGPRVLLDDRTGQYQMWYGGERSDFKTHFGYATSADGISWTKDPANPVFPRGPANWESGDIAFPEVFFDQGIYHMWYSGNDNSRWRIGYAISPKGMTIDFAPADTVQVNDTIWVRVQVDSSKGLVFSAELESPDGSSVDTLQLYDDGAHGDSLSGDGIFAGGWVAANEGAYFVDLKLRLRDTLRFEMNNAATITAVAQGVTRLDTVYTPLGYDGGPLVASVFIPEPGTARGIGVILTHGLSATRLSHQVWCDTLAAQGYVAMTIDYADINQPGGLYPKPVRAFKTAVQFLRKNSARFGISSGKIVAWGQSQGSLVWGQTMIWPNDHVFFGTDSTISDSVDAAVLLYGLYDTSGPMPPWVNDLLTAYFLTNPTLRTMEGDCLANVAKISAPLLLLHASNDPILPVQHSRMLRDSLTSLGVYNRLLEFNSSGYPDGVRQHAFDMTDSGLFTDLGIAAKDSALAFLDRIFTESVPAVEPDDVLPSVFSLEQNYPNPFNPTTRIRYEVMGVSDVKIAVYDMLGREVAVLVNDRKQPGRYEVTFDGTGFASGAYLLRMTAGSFVQTRRMVLIR